MYRSKSATCFLGIIAALFFSTACSKRSKLQNTGGGAVLECEAEPAPSMLAIRGVSASTRIEVSAHDEDGSPVAVSVTKINTNGRAVKYDPRALKRAAAPSQGIPFSFDRAGLYPIRMEVADARGNNAFCDTSVTVLDEAPVEAPEPIDVEPTIPPKVRILAENQQISYTTHHNGTALISWFAEGVQFCVITENGTKPVFMGQPDGGSKQSRGLLGFHTTAKLTESVTFEARCFVGEDTNSQAVQAAVNVDVEELPTVNMQLGFGPAFRDDAVLIPTGAPVSIRWISNASVKECALSVTSASQGQKFVANLPPNGQTTFAPLPENAQYSIHCKDGGNNIAQDAVGVNYLPPTVELTAAPAEIAYGVASTLRWTSQNATSCTGPKDNADKRPSGEVSTGNLTANQTYSISCVGPGGNATDSVTVAVRASCNIHSTDHNSCSSIGRIAQVAVFTPKRTHRIVAQNTHITQAKAQFQAAGPQGFFEPCHAGIGVVPQTLANIPIMTGGNLGSAQCPVEFTAHVTPLIIDVHGEGINLTAPNQGVYFDIRAEGSPVHVSWVANPSNSMFLVLDLNSNGLIDDGTELFGDHSIGPDGEKSHNGFDALAKYDGNKDGFIDAKDEIYGQLQLWADLNKNGISEGSELISLKAGDVSRIDLKYLNVDEKNDFYGNMTFQRSVIEQADGTMRAILDVWFVLATE